MQIFKVFVNDLQANSLLHFLSFFSDEYTQEKKLNYSVENETSLVLDLFVTEVVS